MILRSFAQQRSLKLDFREDVARRMRLVINGDASHGHHMFVDYWGSGDDPKCNTSGLPCVSVTAFTGGSIPKDELTKPTALQEKNAGLLRRQLENGCRNPDP